MASKMTAEEIAQRRATRERLRSEMAEKRKQLQASRIELRRVIKEDDLEHWQNQMLRYHHGGIGLSKLD